ncbi:MAG TPA: FAD-dependent monooxygenase [Casimicrobiaceae bacterium]|nr:FAD-dependent monooxygenase [Casimicrobiaceae bacterium]
MNRAQYDVAIVGAGLVGLALGVALARAGLAVSIVDRNGIAAGEAPVDGSWDTRVYAVSPGSAEFLRALGAWQRLPGERVEAIEAMQIFGDVDGRLGFSAYELGERALAWIVEHRELNAALVEAMRTQPGIDVVAPCLPVAISWHADGAELRLDDGRVVAARLVAGTDGIHSWVRAQAGMLQEPRPYEQSAVVANFTIERAHRGRAFQWFHGGDGVMAWLPLPGRRMSMVWSAPQELATDLLAAEPKRLAQRVEVQGRAALGKLELITPAARFPLSFLKLPSVVAHRLALVGDAAHGVHPLAGQGLNLGFGDVAALLAVLAGRGAIDDPGAPILLESYARRRAAPVLAMQTATDGLARLFGTPAPWLRGLRNRGMSAVDAIGPLKKLLAQPALR